MISKIDLENRILSVVSVHNGLKGVDLVHKVMEADSMITNNEIMDVVFDMTAEGHLIEIEMVFPNRVSKSFIVPKGTLVNVIKRRR